MDTVKKEPKKVEISSAEWQIMRIVWTLKHVTSSEIINLMQKKQRSNSKQSYTITYAWC